MPGCSRMEYTTVWTCHGSSAGGAGDAVRYQVSMLGVLCMPAVMRSIEPTTCTWCGCST
jgi:hypothetical protein